MVVLPVTNDQPGVGARVEWAGVGKARAVGKVETPWLREALREVLHQAAYRERAASLRSKIESVDGLARAAGLVESALGLSTESDRNGSTAPLDPIRTA